MHIQQQHTKTAPKFRCEICKTLLGRKSDLNVHMRKQHAFQVSDSFPQFESNRTLSLSSSLT